MAKKPNPNKTPYKVGRRLYGHIYRLPSGEQVYMARRKTAEIFRSGHSNISDAVRSGEACWALDEETLIHMRIAGIRYVGVEQADLGLRYLTHISNFMDRTKAKVLNYTGRGGSLQRYLPIRHFKVRKML